MSKASPRIATDQPVLSTDNDLFGRAPVGHHLARTLLSVATERPPVVGVVGPWGAGKTSVLHFAEQYLKDDKGPEILWFNAWRHSVAGPGALQEALLAQVSSLVLSKVKRGTAKLQDAAREYRAGLSEPLRRLPLVGNMSASGVEQVLAAIPGNRGMIDKALIERARPLIVFVDDVDRLTGPQLLELFAVLRVTADLPYVLYVVAYDPGQVALTLESHLGIPGHQYLEKVVALPFPVGAVPFSSLYALCLAQLAETLTEAGFDTEFLRGWFSDAFSSVLRAHLKTPRDVLRYCNRIAALAPLAFGAELEAEDFVIVEALAVFDLELYEALHENSAVALLRTGVRDVLARDKSKKPEVGRAERVFGEMVDPKVDEVLSSSRVAALGEILPALEATLTGMPGTNAVAEIRRLAHVNYFNRYFSLTAAGNDVRDEVVQQGWDRVLAGDDFGAVFGELVTGLARSVIVSKIIAAVDSRPPSVAAAKRIVPEIERLFDAELTKGPLFVPLPFTSDGVLELDRISCHIVARAAALEGVPPQPLLKAVLKTLQTPTFFCDVGKAWLVYEGPGFDGMAWYKKALRPRLTKLLLVPGVLGTFAGRSEALRDVAFIAKNARLRQLWTDEVKADPELAPVILRAVDRGIHFDNDAARYKSITEFIDPDALKAALAATNRIDEHSRLWRKYLDAVDTVGAAAAKFGR